MRTLTLTRMTRKTPQIGLGRAGDASFGLRIAFMRVKKALGFGLGLVRGFRLRLRLGFGLVFGLA